MSGEREGRGLRSQPTRRWGRGRVLLERRDRRWRGAAQRRVPGRSWVRLGRQHRRDAEVPHAHPGRPIARRGCATRGAREGRCEGGRAHLGDVVDVDVCHGGAGGEEREGERHELPAETSSSRPDRSPLTRLSAASGADAAASRARTTASCSEPTHPGDPTRGGRAGSDWPSPLRWPLLSLDSPHPSSRPSSALVTELLRLRTPAARQRPHRVECGPPAPRRLRHARLLAPRRLRASRALRTAV